MQKTTPVKKKASGHAIIPVPRTLVRLNSSDRVEDLQESLAKLKDAAEDLSLGDTLDLPPPQPPLLGSTSSRGTAFLVFDSTPDASPQEKEEKRGGGGVGRIGTSIKTNAISTIFRLSKELERRERFKDYRIFDEYMSVLKRIYGLYNVKSSTLEISNQSLSRLIHFFDLDSKTEESIRQSKEKTFKHFDVPDHSLTRRKSSMSYFDKIKMENKYFNDSSIVTEEILKQVGEKVKNM